MQTFRFSLTLVNGLFGWVSDQFDLVSAPRAAAAAHFVRQVAALRHTVTTEVVTDTVAAVTALKLALL